MYSRESYCQLKKFGVKKPNVTGRGGRKRGLAGLPLTLLPAAPKRTNNKQTRIIKLLLTVSFEAFPL